MMARKNRIKVGGTSIEISKVMDQVVEQVRQGAAGEVLLAMESFQKELQEIAEKDWPVGRDRKALSGEPVGPSTGKISRPRVHSAELFERETVLTDSGVQVTLRNTARWSWAVRFGQKAKSGQTKGRKAWTEIVSKPGRKEARKLPDSLQKQILELADRAMEK